MKTPEAVVIDLFRQGYSNLPGHYSHDLSRLLKDKISNSPVALCSISIAIPGAQEQAASKQIS